MATTLQHTVAQCRYSSHHKIRIQPVWTQSLQTGLRPSASSSKFPVMSATAALYKISIYPVFINTFHFIILRQIRWEMYTQHNTFGTITVITPAFSIHKC
jgi:hypothetical protein